MMASLVASFTDVNSVLQLLPLLLGEQHCSSTMPPSCNALNKQLDCECHNQPTAPASAAGGAALLKHHATLLQCTAQAASL
jgi:hypothetical protein